METLVDPRQPSWFLYGALRGLALFTSSEFGVYLPLAYVLRGNVLFSLTHPCACAAHTGKELYKRFLSVPGTSPNQSQGGGDLDMGMDPDIEIVHEDVKIPHLEYLCLQLGDHTRDADDVSRVSDCLTSHTSHVFFPCACI